MRKCCLIIILFSLIENQCYSQDILSSKEALALHKEIKIKHSKIHLEEDPESYFKFYFEQLDLLPLIKNHHDYVLSEYYNRGYNFRYYNLPRETIVNYKLFLRYYFDNEAFLPESVKAYFSQRIPYAYGNLADAYSKNNQESLAKIQHEKSIKYSASLNSIRHPSALNNYGLYYLNLQEPNTALIYLKKAYDITKKEYPNHHLLGSIKDNIADIYLEQKKIKKANTFYAENFRFYKAEFNDKIDVSRLISAGVQTVITDIKLNQTERATIHFNELKAVMNTSDYDLESLPKSRLEFLKLKELILIKANNFKESYMVSKQIFNLSDSLSVISKAKQKNIKNAINDGSLNRIRTNYELEKAQKENKIQRQRLKLWLVLIGSSSILIFLGSLFLRRRQHLINAKNKQLIAEQNLKITVLKNDQLQSEVVSKKRDLSDFAINLNQNQEWAKLLVEKWDILKGTKGRQRKLHMDAFEKDLQSKISFDDETKDFYARIDELSDTFYSLLNMQFPHLTKTEKRLCSLIRLKIGSHEITTLQNITLASLNTSRYRLRKKMNLIKEVDLDTFIQSL